MATSAVTPDASLDARRELLDAAALHYDAQHDGPLEVVAAYRGADGTYHEVAINRHEDLEWRVLDIAGSGEAVLVERLSGYDDRRDQARALAIDYGDQCAAHAAGLRPDPPILRPPQMRMSVQPPRPRRHRSAAPQH